MDGSSLSFVYSRGVRKVITPRPLSTWKLLRKYEVEKCGEVHTLNGSSCTFAAAAVEQLFTYGNMGRLDSKVIVVTGAGAGFGRGIVKKLTAEGAKVLAVDLNGETVKQTADAAPAGSCLAHTADITSEESWRGILEAAKATFLRIDTVVNCAGVVHNAAPSHQVPEEQFDLMFKVNVKPLYLSTKVFIPYWKENKIEGHFINMSSISQPRPRPNLVWYAASKGAVTVVRRFPEDGFGGLF